MLRLGGEEGDGISKEKGSSQSRPDDTRLKESGVEDIIRETRKVEEFYLVPSYVSDVKREVGC